MKKLAIIISSMLFASSYATSFDEQIEKELGLTEADKKAEVQFENPFAVAAKSLLTPEEFAYFEKLELSSSNLSDREVELLNKVMQTTFSKQQFVEMLKRMEADIGVQSLRDIYARVKYEIPLETYSSYNKTTENEAKEKVVEPVSVKVDKVTTNIDTPNGLSPRNMNSNLFFASLPFEYAVKVVYGNGEKVMAEFMDVECPFCAQQGYLFKNNQNLVNTTVYKFLVNNKLDKSTTDKNNYFWCADNREELIVSWENFWATKVGNVDVDAAFLEWKTNTPNAPKVVEKCADPTDYNRAWMSEFSSNATPLNIFPTLKLVNTTIDFQNVSLQDFNEFFKPSLTEEQEAGLDYKPLNTIFNINIDALIEAKKLVKDSN